jgi:hypothetical protein
VSARASVLFVCVLSATGHAFPISPSTLWDLTADAELIVVARVGASRPSAALPLTYKEANRDFSKKLFGEDFVQLEVLQTLVGPRLQRLEVANSTAITCPAPAELVSGRKALVFLSQHGAEWSVVHLSYGALYPTDRELPVYLARVRAALALQRAHPTPAQLQEWAVATAEDPATRWDGLYLLAASFDDHAYFDRGRHDAHELTPTQRDRLAAAFIKSPTTDTTLGMSLALLRDVKNPALDAAFVGAFDTALAHEDNSLGELLLALRVLLERFVDKPSVVALVGPEDTYDPNLSISMIEKAWRTARERFPIPAGAPVEPRAAPAVQGTGSGTPF